MSMAFELKVTRIADIALQEASLNIWDTKYRLKTKAGEAVDRDINGTFERVAKALAAVEEPARRGEWYERFLWALQCGVSQARHVDDQLHRLGNHQRFHARHSRQGA
jgi:ribonucleoside-diphosphate reductase alpha chain